MVVIVVAIYLIARGSVNGETRYVTEIVKKGNITIAATGTGQVEASNTLTLKPKTTGDITYVGVKVGETVRKGKLIASVDSRDAKIALENAKISLAKLTTPDSLTLLQKQNSLTKSYSDAWNNVASFINNMDVMLDEVYGLYDADGYLSYSNTMALGRVGKEKVTLSESSYYDAKDSINDLSDLYESLSQTSSREEIKNLVDKAYESARVIATTIKTTEQTFNYVIGYLDDQNDSLAISTKTDISSWLTDSNSYVSNLLSSINSIDEDNQSLKDLTIGADDLDVRSAELTLLSKQYSYNDCFIYAPFDGVIATLTAKVGESSGSSIGTLITNQKIATISFNEVDIASIKLDQNVNLTFDSIEGLTILGIVAEIDPVGTVSSGVVTYNVKISFDSKDERIKPGMSVNSEIVIEEKKDILVIESSAIKTRNGRSSVDVFENPIEGGENPQGATSTNPPTRKMVELGLSDDTVTEIVSGLKEGDQIISKIITGSSLKSSTAKSTTTAPSILNSVGGRPPVGATGEMRIRE